MWRADERSFDVAVLRQRVAALRRTISRAADRWDARSYRIGVSTQAARRAGRGFGVEARREGPTTWVVQRGATGGGTGSPIVF
jgi:hypothetical protein